MSYLFLMFKLFIYEIIKTSFLLSRFADAQRTKRMININAPDWQIKICQSVDLYFASQNINLLMINIFCKAKNINQEADLINPKGLLNLL